VTPLIDYAGRHENAHNGLQSLALIGAVALPTAIAFRLLWGWTGVAVVLAASAAIYAVAPRLPPALFMRLYRGRPLQPSEGGQIGYILAQLAKRAGLGAAPRIYLIPSMTRSAFAAGSPDGAAIGITEGLLRSLSLREVAGVLAHELGHVCNNDLPLMGLADVLTRASLLLAYLAVLLGAINLPDLLLGDSDVPLGALLLLYLAPCLSSLVQLVLPRAREYDADADGARLSGDPAGLAAALEKLEAYRGSFLEDLMPPVPMRRIPFPSLLRAHPPTAERLRRLIALKANELPPPLEIVEEPMVSMVGFGPGALQPRFRFPFVWF
jgi:heat shock protein HtpX